MSTDRYARQMMLPGFGDQAQEKLRQSTVGIMGIGGLGSPAATYLAAAGVGRLVLVDHQMPDITNLNRQTLHWEEDLGTRSKVESAAWKLGRFSPEVAIEPKAVKVTTENIAEVFRGAEVILDCLDSFIPRMILNEHAIEVGVPVVHAAVEGWHGQLTTIVPGDTPCLRCIFPKAPEKKALFPILGPTAGVFGCLEATEAIKLLTGLGEPLRSKLLVGDLQNNRWDTIEIDRAENCAACKKVRR